MKTPPILFALIALIATACPKDGDQHACTDLAAASVMVDVTDDSGDAVPDVTVKYQPADAAWADCEDYSAQDGEHFVCGYEVKGEITVTASAPGFDDATKTVTVALDDDGCHVVGQSITITMTPTATP